MSAEPYKIGILSSALPTRCGIAAFTAALGGALSAPDTRVSVVRVVDHADEVSEPHEPIVGYLVNDKSSSKTIAINELNKCDVAIIQHEYGLYGGRDGGDVVTVLDGLHVPRIAILHTVLPRPTPHQLKVLNEVIARVDAVVIMTVAAENILRQVYHVANMEVRVIAHGATLFGDTVDESPAPRPRILTWGLIGPGKGIEWVIDALMGLEDLSPLPLYVVAGLTHPKVLANCGDAYRDSLIARAQRNGVESMTLFDGNYRSLESLGALIGSASVVVLPYDSTDQATSGVLVDAIAAGRPVIATAFPHAVELLESGAGIIVEHGDARAIARALRHVLTEPSTAMAMSTAARKLAPELSWHAVAAQYQTLTRQLRDLAHV